MARRRLLSRFSSRFNQVMTRPAAGQKSTKARLLRCVGLEPMEARTMLSSGGSPEPLPLDAPAVTQVYTSSVYFGIEPGFTPITVQFNADVDPATIGNSDVSFLDQNTLYTTTPYFSFYDAPTRTATYYAYLPEGNYDFTLADGAVLDANGNAIDGDFNNTPGGAFFVGNVTSDSSNVLGINQNFTAIKPDGSLIYTQTVNGFFNAEDDTDFFSIEVSGNQTLSLKLDAVPAMTAQFNVVDVNGDTVASGSDLSMLNSIPLALEGIYTIGITGDGPAHFTLEFNLNADLENEYYDYGGFFQRNDTFDVAQNLDGTATPLLTGFDRLAVEGNSDDDSEDWYSFTLEQDQFATIQINQDIYNGNLGLELYNSDGLLLASASENSSHYESNTFNLVLRDFKAPATGTYYVRLVPGGSSGGGGESSVTPLSTGPGDYRLVVVRGGTIETDEGNRDFYSRQVLNTNRVVGSLRAGTAAGNGFSSSFSENETGDDIYQATNILSFGYPVGGNLSLNYISGNLNNASDLDFYRFSASPGDALNFYVESYDLSQPRIQLVDAYGNLITEGNSFFTAGDYNSFFFYFQFDQYQTAGDFYLRISDDLGTVGSYNLNFNLSSPHETGFDNYEIYANPGDEIVIRTSTPSTPQYPWYSPGQTLNVGVDLYDNAGNFLAVDYSSAPDGQNAELRYTVGGFGQQTFVVRVFAESGVGDYVLDVQGTQPNFPTINTYPYSFNDGQVFQEFPGSFEVSFSEPVLTSSVDSSDFLLNGVQADSVSVSSNGRYATFYFSTAGAGTGSYSIQFPDGGVQGISGQFVLGFNATVYAQTPPNVTASSLTAGDLLSPGSLTYTATFSDFIDGSYLSNDDFRLINLNANTTTNATSFTHDFATRTITASFPYLGDGDYELRLISGYINIKGNNGLFLDGGPSFPLPSGDGVGGDDFVVRFNVDIDSANYPTLENVPPVGSLVYDPTVSGSLLSDSDTDTYNITIEAGQRLAARFTSLSPDLKGYINILDDDGNLIAYRGAADFGQDFIVPLTAPLAGGLYHIVVSAAGGAGGYKLDLVLNAVIEDEVSEPNNDIFENTDLRPSSIPIGPSGADRLAAIGNTTDGNDWYYFDLQPGQYATILLTAISGPLPSLSLHDFSETPIAVGSAGATNTGLSITDFAYNASSGGAYRIHVQGAAGSQYNLVVTRGSTFEREANDVPGSEDNLGPTLNVLGYLRGNGNAISNETENNNSIANANDLTGSFSPTGNANEYSTTVYGSIATTLDDDYFRIRANVGDVLTIDQFNQGISDTFLFLYNRDGTLITLDDDSGSGLNSRITVTIGSNSSMNYSGDYFIRADAFGSRTGGYGLTVKVNGQNPTERDRYSFAVNGGENLIITTTTPGDGTGEPSNNLNPRIELFDPAGNLVSSDDNSAADGRNARLEYNVPAGVNGRYTVALSGLGIGAYTLNVAGAPAQPNTLSVVSTSPTNGRPFSTPPTFVDILWSDDILIGSLSADDLTIDGDATVDSAQLINGRTARFFITASDNVGTFTYTLAAGALNSVSGATSTAYTGSFVVDHTGPRVLSTSPAAQASAPFNTLTFNFNEDIDPASVTLNDVVSFLDPNGTERKFNISKLTVTGSTLTIQFSSLFVAGTYTLTLGPGINDIAGNPMDQNQDSSNGQSDDTFVATVSVQSPDLTVSNVTAPSTGVLGQTVNVQWTVTNTGSDPATEGWTDRVYLSSDGTFGFDDLFLGNYTPAATTLAAGATYNGALTVTLPLSASYLAGNYRIIVVTDATGRQPESNEANNSSASAVIALSQPALPDLIVSSITAPAESFAGQPVQISWTLTNQGTAAATGSWYDYLYLSTDNFIGGDFYQGAFLFTGTIPAGGSITRTQTITPPLNFAGNYRAVVYTDGSGSINEVFNENNNVAIDDQPLNLIRPPVPNLIVSSVTPPPSVFSGQSTQVDFTVTNTGTGGTNAPVWYDAVYLSLDSVLDGTDIFMGIVANPSFLAAGDSYASSLNVTLPVGISGDYRFIVRSDIYNQVNELENENDNTRAGGLTTVTLTPPPDLRVDNVNAPSTAFSGQPMNLSFVVTNHGTGSTVSTGWFDAIYMSTDDVLDTANDTQISGYFHAGALAVGGSYNVNAIVNLPVGLSGQRYFFVVTDSANNVFEYSSENNNTNFDAGVTTINLTPPPDLLVTDIAAPTDAIAGQPVSITYTVENHGSDATPQNSWTDAFYLSTDGTLDTSSDLLLGARTRVGALDVDGLYTATATFTLPALLTGQFHVFVVTDSSNVVFELDNANNTLKASNTLNVALLPPDLRVTSATAPTAALAGNAVLVQWTAQNQGTGPTQAVTWYDGVYISSNDILGDGDDVLLNSSSQRTGPLAVNASYSASALVTLPLTLATGNYRLYVRTDAGNVVVESIGESNNYSTALPISITQQTADLLPSAVGSSASATSGQPLTINYRVDNVGAAATNTGNWYDTIYLSTNNTLDSGDVTLGSIYRSSILNSGAGYNASATFTLPIDLSGTFFVIVKSDSGNNVFEAGGENNNIATSAATVAVTLSGVPNLTVTAVDAPASGIAGQPVTVNWTVQNDGSSSAQNWVDRVFLSSDQVFDINNDVAVGFKDRLGGLASGSSYNGTGTFTLPAGVSGLFYVFVLTDGTNAVYERAAGELNNSGYDPLSINVTLPPPADLTVGTITVPANATLGQNVTITYTVSNNSSNAAVGQWLDSLYVSSDATFDVGDKLLGKVLHTGGVAANGSYTETLIASLPGVTPGLYHIIVRSDILNSLPETSESNNLGASLNRADIDAQALTLDVPTSGNLGNGQAAYYKVTVEAGQTLRFFFDSSIASGGNELFVSFGATPSRSDFDFGFQSPLSPDQEIIVPKTRAGTYYVLAYGNAVSGTPAYDITAQIIPFSVRSATPSQAGDTGLVTLDIQGARFDRATTFTLVGPGGQELDALVTRFENGAQAQATFDLTAAALGQWTLRATPESGAAVTLSNALTVAHGQGAHLTTSISGPSAVRANRVEIFTVYYGNDGGADAIAPLLIVTSPTGTSFSDSESNVTESVPLAFLGSSSSPLAGVLAPGQQNGKQFYFNSTVLGQAQFRVEVISANNTTPIDWALVESSARPADITDEAWDALWPLVQSSIGSTFGDYVRALAHDASLLPAELGDNRSISDLLALRVSRVLASTQTSISGVANAQSLDVDITGRSVIARNLTTGELFVTTSLADGSFVFESVTPGSYDVTFEGAGVASLTLTSVDPFDVAADESLTGLELELTARGSIGGTVRVVGSPLAVANASVQAVAADGSRYTAIADADGNYLIEGLPDGNYTLVADAPGRARTFVTGVAAEAGALTSRDVSMAAQSVITGSVSLEAGSPAGSLVVIAKLTGSTDPLKVYSVSTSGLTFSLTGLPAGTYDLRLSHDGCIPGIVIGVVVGAATTVNVGTIALELGGSIAGSVDTSLVPGLDPVATVVGVYLGGTLVNSVPVNADGSYSLDGLTPGNYTLKVITLTGFGSQTNVNITDHESFTGVALNVLPGATILGQVTRSGGSSAVAGAFVYAVNAAGDVYVTSSQSDGSYSFTGLPTGDYAVSLQVTTTGALSSVNAASLSGQYTADLSLTFAATLRGNLLKSDGTNAGAGSVELYEDGRFITGTPVNEDGEYRLDLIRGGTFDLIARAGGVSFALLSGVTVAAGGNVTQDLTAGNGTLDITAVDASGVTGDVVTVYQQLLGRQIPVADVIVGAGGVVTVTGLAAGSYTLKLASDEDHRGAITTASVSAGATTSATLTAVQYHAVGGTISDSGGAVAGAIVTIIPSASPAFPLTVLTDASGAYSLPAVPDGAFEIIIGAAGRVTAVSSGTVSGANVTKDLTLTLSTSSLAGRLVDDLDHAVPNAVVEVYDIDGHLLGTDVTGGDGTYSINTAVGASLLLKFSAPGYPSVSLFGVSVGSGSNVNVGDTTLEPVAVAVDTTVADPDLGLASLGALTLSESIEALGGSTPGWFESLLRDLQRDPNEVTLADIPAIPPQLAQAAAPLLAKLNLHIREEQFYWEQLQISQQQLQDAAKFAARTGLLELFAGWGTVASLAVNGLELATAAGLKFTGAAARQLTPQLVEGASSATLTTLKGLNVTQSITEIVGSIVAVKNAIGETISAGSVQTALNKLQFATTSLQNVADSINNLIKILEAAEKTGELSHAFGKFASGVSILGKLIGIRDSINASTFAETQKSLTDLDYTKQEYNKYRYFYKSTVKKADASKKDLEHFIDTYLESRDDLKEGIPWASEVPPAIYSPLVVAPRDPNDIIGPAGSGENFWTAPGTWNYKIRFENASDASAPAQEVVVTQQLDSDLDFRTFRVDDLGFGDFRLELPANRAFYNGRLDLTEDRGFLVDVSVSIDIATGFVTWRLTTIDPETGEIPLDPTIGFLPPNNEDGVGDGFVSYTIRPRANRVTGDVVDAEARIVFDSEKPIDTPPIFNTLDVGLPSSEVAPLPATAPGEVFPVTWSGQDIEGGSGLSFFDIFVSIDGAAPVLWLDDTTLTQADYVGTAGHSYAFFSVARDLAGNEEAAPATPDATTTVPSEEPENTAPVVSELVVDSGSINEGQTFTATGSFTDPDADDTFTATVDYGDGSGPQPLTLNPDKTFTLSHTYADNKSDNSAYHVVVTITDSFGESDEVSTDVNVANVAPVIEAGGDQTVVLGTVVQLTGSASDVGADTHSATVEWGDGTSEAATIDPVTGTVSASHNFTASGVFTVTLTVTDDDGASTSDTFSVTVNLVGVTLRTEDSGAGESGSETGNFLINQSASSPVPVLVGFTIEGSATYGVDYTLSFVGGTLATFNTESRSGQIALPAGGGSVRVFVIPVDDALGEMSESVALTLQPGTTYTLPGNRTGSVSIVDDDAVELSVVTRDATATEGSVTNTGRFEVRRNQASGALDVPFTLLGSASATDDYSFVVTGGATLSSFDTATRQGVLSLSPGATAVSVVVTALSDLLQEGTETVNFALKSSGAGSGYVLNKKASGSVRITDIDATEVSARAKVARALEAGNVPGRFEIARTIATAAPITVGFDLAGTALTDGDYTVSFTGVVDSGFNPVDGSGWVTLPAGKSLGAVIITPTTDGLAEGTESVRLTLRTGADYLKSKAAAPTLSIIDADAAQISVTAKDKTAQEPGYDTAEFEFTRVGDGLGVLQVGFSLSGKGVLGVDYTLNATGGALVSLNAGTGVGTIQFAAGQTSVRLVVTPIDRPGVTTERGVKLTLTAGTYLLAPGKSNATIKIKGSTGVADLSLSGVSDLSSLTLTPVEVGG